MPKSDHLHFDFFCASRMTADQIGPLGVFAGKNNHRTGGLGSCVPALHGFLFAGGLKRRAAVGDASRQACLANTGGFLSINAKALRRIGVVERRFFSRTTRLALGK